MKILVYGLIFLLDIFYSSAQRPKLIIPIGHSALIKSINFSTDGKYLVTAGDDKTAKVWEVASGKLILNFEDFKGPVYSANFSHDKKWLVTVSIDSTERFMGSVTSQWSTIKIWNLTTGEINKILRWPGSDYFIKGDSYVAYFSQDDQHIFVEDGHPRSSLYAFDFFTGKSLYTLDEGLIAVSQNNKYIVTIPPSYRSNDSIAKILDAETGNMVKTFQLKGHPQSVSYDKNDTKILVTYFQDSPRVYEAISGKLLYTIPVIEDCGTISFSPAGNYILSVCKSKTKMWDASNGMFIDSLRGDQNFKGAHFSLDQKYIITQDDSSAVKIWDAHTRKPAYNSSIKTHAHNPYFKVDFCPVTKYFIGTTSEREQFGIWETFTGNIIYDSGNDKPGSKSYFSFSADGKYIAVSKYDKIKILNTETGNFINFQAIANLPSSSKFSPDGKYIVTMYSNGKTAISELLTGKFLYYIKDSLLIDAMFSKDGKLLLSNNGRAVKVWDAARGMLLHTLKSQDHFNSVNFSFDGKKIVTAENNKIKVWQVGTMDSLEIITPDFPGQVADFTLDGKFILSENEIESKEGNRGQGAILWEAKTGKRITEIPALGPIRSGSGRHPYTSFNFFPQKNLCSSSDGKYLAAIRTARGHENISIVNMSTGEFKILPDTSYTFDKFLNVNFNSEGTHVVAVCADGEVKTWDISSGRLTKSNLHYTLNAATFSRDKKYLITSCEDYTSKIWDPAGKLLYTLISVGSTDYLVTDSAGRYDGTENAKRLLYYVCGSEVIELDQLKKLSWEPGLAGKIMGINQEPVTAKKLSEVDICGYTPLVEDHGYKDSLYHFTITPRAGGVGDVALFVGNKQVRTYNPARLVKENGKYQLTVTQKDIKNYLISGEGNSITIKATTSNNQLSSKGPPVPVETKVDSAKKVIPNLYCISVGICQYKKKDSPTINLNYSSRDAADFEQAVTASARKFFNTDGKEHVSSYLINTDAKSADHWPTKESIKKAFDDIADKATANDILLIFLSGHGIISNKQFYYLTADAASFDLNGVEDVVAISADTLNSWMLKVRAQKQVLILDACNSGEAIQNLIIRKKDIPADQERALEKLKDMTGTYILSASASGQSAYETSEYNQGLLTYSLLLGMKSGKALKDNKFVDISNWFHFAVDNVNDLARDINQRQNPKISENGTFELGIMDKELQDKIKLAAKKSSFGRSNFQNEDLKRDNLKIGPAIDKELYELNFKKESLLVYYPDYSGNSAYTINGGYNIRGNNIMMEVILYKGELNVAHFTVNSTTDKIDELVKEVLQKVNNKLIDLPVE